MSTELSNFQPDEQSIARYLGLNPSDAATHAVIAVCQRYDLDPVLKHVIVIPKGGVYLTRDGLLHIAHRSGQLDGIVVDQDPTLVDGEWIARVSVYRKDMRFPFTFPGRYPVNGGNRQYAQEMALKAAEAHALRRAFDVNGLPTIDERRPETDRPRTATVDDLTAPVEVLEHVDAVEMINPAQSKALHAGLHDVGATDREAGLFYIGGTIGRDVESTKDLTRDEASTVLDAIRADLEARVAAETHGGAE